MAATRIQIIGGDFTDVLGQPLAYGTLEFILNQDAVIPGVGEICAGIKVIANLDKTGNINGTTTFPVVSVAVTAGVVIVTSNADVTPLLSVGDTVVFPTGMTASFLDGQSLIVTAINPDTGDFTADFDTSDYPITGETGIDATVGEAVLIWPNDTMAPLNTFYRVTAYTAEGETAWGMNYQQVLSFTQPDPFDVGGWIPNELMAWVPPLQQLVLTANGVALSSQQELGINAGTGININDFGSGQVFVSEADPRTIVKMYDDFIRTATNNPSSGDQINDGGAGINFYVNYGPGFDLGSIAWIQDPGTYGVLEITTGIISGETAGLFANDVTGEGEAPYSTTQFDLLFRVALGGLTQIALFCGVSSCNGPFGEDSDDVIGIAFHADPFDSFPGDTQWTAVTKRAGASTRTPIAGTLDTGYHTLRIRSVASGTILFSVDGGVETPVTSNIPTVNLAPHLSLITTNTGAVSAKIDYFWHAYSITR